MNAKKQMKQSNKIAHMNNNLLIFIVVAAIILGAVYYFSTPAGEPLPMQDSTSLPALEQELSDTDVEGLDQEFADIEMELEAAISEAEQ